MSVNDDGQRSSSTLGEAYLMRAKIVHLNILEIFNAKVHHISPTLNMNYIPKIYKDAM